MERILSQHEIDELIRDLVAERDKGAAAAVAQEPAVAVGNVVPYDFRRPSKFSRDQLRSLERIHQQFGRLLGILLGARLRTDMACRVLSVQQLTYGEFIRSVPNPSCIGVLDFGAGGDHVVVQLSMDLALSIYERMVGGPGSARVPAREPTDIELRVLRHQILRIVADAYHQAWATFIPIEIRMRELEINPMYINLALDQDTVLWVSMALEIGERSDTMNLCLPYSALEPLLPRLSNEFLLTGQARSRERDRERLRRALRDTLVPLQAVLGTARLEVRELMELKVGDVLVLETGVHDEIEVHVANRPKFRGQVGRLHGRLAVRLTGPLHPPEPEEAEAAPEAPDAGVPAGGPAAGGAAANAAGAPAPSPASTPRPGEVLPVGRR